jgi:hypothetical protein
MAAAWQAGNGSEPFFETFSKACPREYAWQYDDYAGGFDCNASSTRELHSRLWPHADPLRERDPDSHGHCERNADTYSKSNAHNDSDGYRNCNGHTDRQPDSGRAADAEDDASPARFRQGRLCGRRRCQSGQEAQDR